MLRAFLKRNKIFFETGAATLLSAMAVILSIAQYDLAKIQTETARQQALPHFVIATRQVMDAEDRMYVEDRIYVNNLGGIARDLESNTAVFFDVDIAIQDIGHHRKLQLPVSGYYGITRPTDNGIGQVLEISGYLNNKKFVQLERDSRKLTAERKGLYCVIQIRRYLKLDYLDVFNKEHVDYFSIPRYGGRPMEPREGKKIFDKYNASFKDLEIADFDKLTAENLFERVKKQGEYVH